MRLHCAIVEDIAEEAQLLARTLDAVVCAGCTISSVLFSSGEAFLESCQAGQTFDVVFLDVCMPGINGIETARRLRENVYSSLLVFVTSSEEYVWEAFPLHPFDYLRKPYDAVRIARLLEDVVRTLQRTEPELEVRVARQQIHIPYDKIQYALAQNHCVSVMTDVGEYRASATFSQLSALLCQQPQFLLCNRGVIVNMDRVMRFENDAIQMLNGTSFPLRQKDKKRLMVEFTQYQFRHMRREV